MENKNIENLDIKKIPFIIFYAKISKTEENEEEIVEFSAIKIKNNEVKDFIQFFIQVDAKILATSILENRLDNLFLEKNGLKKNIAFNKIYSFINQEDVLIDLGFTNTDYLLLLKNLEFYTDKNFAKTNLCIKLNSSLKKIMSIKNMSFISLERAFKIKNYFPNNIYNDVISLVKIVFSYFYILEKNKINYLSKKYLNFEDDLKLVANLNFDDNEIISIQNSVEKYLNSNLYYKNLMTLKISLRENIESKIENEINTQNLKILKNVLNSQEFDIKDYIKTKNLTKNIDDSVEIKIDLIENKIKTQKKLAIKEKKNKIDKNEIFKFSIKRRNKLKPKNKK